MTGLARKSARKLVGTCSQCPDRHSLPISLYWLKRQLFSHIISWAIFGKFIHSFCLLPGRILQLVCKRIRQNRIRAFRIKNLIYRARPSDADVNFPYQCETFSLIVALFTSLASAGGVAVGVGNDVHVLMWDCAVEHTVFSKLTANRRNQLEV